MKLRQFDRYTFRDIEMKQLSTLLVQDLALVV